MAFRWKISWRIHFGVYVTGCNGFGKLDSSIGILSKEYPSIYTYVSLQINLLVGNRLKFLRLAWKNLSSHLPWVNHAIQLSVSIFCPWFWMICIFVDYRIISSIFTTSWASVVHAWKAWMVQSHHHFFHKLMFKWDVKRQDWRWEIDNESLH